MVSPYLIIVMHSFSCSCSHHGGSWPVYLTLLVNEHKPKECLLWKVFTSLSPASFKPFPLSNRLVPPSYLSSSRPPVPSSYLSSSLPPVPPSYLSSSLPVLERAVFELQKGVSTRLYWCVWGTERESKARYTHVCVSKLDRWLVIVGWAWVKCHAEPTA